MKYIEETYGKYHLNRENVTISVWCRGQLKLYNPQNTWLQERTYWSSDNEDIAEVDSKK